MKKLILVVLTTLSMTAFANETQTAPAAANQAIEAVETTTTPVVEKAKAKGHEVASKMKHHGHKMKKKMKHKMKKAQEAATEATKTE